jgi:hypothetical protein
LYIRIHMPPPTTDQRNESDAPIRPEGIGVIRRLWRFTRLIIFAEKRGDDYFVCVR